jgi:serine/threonine protein kinase
MNNAQPDDDLQPTVVYVPAVEGAGTIGPSADGTVCGARNSGSIEWGEFKAGQFGQYRLKGKLGAGGMGELYEAEHLLLRRPCAIKLIKPGNEARATALARFEREVRAAARLSHWNTAQIYDYGHTDDGTFYYVMELLPGLDLDELVRRYGPLAPERAVHFLRQTCDALREAHAVGLIHRDIKPANIFAAQRGGVYDVAKLLDFGLVKLEAGEDIEDLHASGRGGFSGSPLYMAPEQAIRYRDVDARSDLYSLGAVAYYLLTGRPPFSGKCLFEVIRAHFGDDVVRPSRVRAGVPADVEEVVLRCLRKDLDGRFQSAQELQEALSRCQSADKWTQQRAAAWWREIEAP